MAMQRVPIETWQAILRYSIAVPVFFEPDPIETCGFHDYALLYQDEMPYWKSERRRNVLRRVCSSWNIYLRLFSSRYVNLSDINDGHLPITAISQAIRLHYGANYHELFYFRRIIQNAILQCKAPWSLEILHGEQPQIDELILARSKVPHLRGVSYIEDMDPSYMAISAPDLRYINLSLGWDFSSIPFHLSQLTTLRILTTSVTPLLVGDFPSLRHLSISTHSSFLDPEDMILLLRALGKNLVTFFDASNPSTALLPDEIWLLCPKVERFQTGLQWPSNPLVPSSLHTIRISTDFLYSSEPFNPRVIPAGLMQKRSIQTVALDEAWGRMLDNLNDLMECVIHFMNYGSDIRDIIGVQFQEFIVDMLLHRARNCRRPFLPEYRSDNYLSF